MTTSKIPEEVKTTSIETFTAILSDMDGTLMDSTAAVVDHWTRIANELSIPPSAILSTSHGRRTIDVLRIHAPERANMAYVHEVESLIPKLYASEAKILPGTLHLVSSLVTHHVPWAIVTSGTTILATSWLKVMNISEPEYFVTADDVEHGKPDPECYLLGLERVFKGHNRIASLEELGEEERRKVLVLEDAPAGIRAGKSAGCTVLAVLTTHDRAEVEEAGADWVVDDLSCVEFVSGGGEGGVQLKIVGEKIR